MSRSRETGRERYWRQVRRIADDDRVSIPEARRRWPERYGRARAAVRAVARATVQTAQAAERVVEAIIRPAFQLVVRHVEDVAPVCPICRDALDETQLRCPGCTATYHAECARDVRRCAVLGCRRAFVFPATPPPAAPTHPTAAQTERDPTNYPHSNGSLDWEDRSFRQRALITTGVAVVSIGSVAAAILSTWWLWTVLAIVVLSLTLTVYGALRGV